MQASLYGLRKLKLKFLLLFHVFLLIFFSLALFNHCFCSSPCLGDFCLCGQLSSILCFCLEAVMHEGVMEQTISACTVLHFAIQLEGFLQHLRDGASPRVPSTRWENKIQLEASVADWQAPWRN